MDSIWKRTYKVLVIVFVVFIVAGIVQWFTGPVFRVIEPVSESVVDTVPREQYDECVTHMLTCGGLLMECREGGD